MARRMEGKFYGMDVEERLDKLEEDLSITNGAVEEFIIWFKQGRQEI